MKLARRRLLGNCMLRAGVREFRHIDMAFLITLSEAHALRFAAILDVMIDIADIAAVRRWVSHTTRDGLIFW